MVQYKIDNTSFSTYHIYVSSSKGIIGRPAPKQRRSVDYADMHGIIVNTSSTMYEARKIELSCFISAQNKTQMLTSFFSFCDILQGPGTHRLYVAVEGSEDKALMFEVYCDGDMEVQPEWNESTHVGTFTIKLVEPNPVKRIYRVHPNSISENRVTIDIVTKKPVDIHWGDGQHELCATTGQYKRYYEEAFEDEAYVVIAGDIDNITSVSINATNEIIWSKL